MQPFKLMVVLASTRPVRAGAPVARWVVDNAAARAGIEVTLVDLKQLGLPFLDEHEHPMRGKYQHDHTKQWSAAVADTDAFIFVMPEYNHSFTAPLKNAIDFLHSEWAHKPVGFASYGGVAAGTRAVQALKPVLSALSMIPLTTAVAIPMVHNHIVDGTFVAPPEIDKAIGAVLDGLGTYVEVLRPLRAA